MTNPTPIYLDNHATTRVDPRVLDAMLPWFSERYGNAASRSHGMGRDAEDAVEDARLQIASTIAARPREIVYTSGATEALNLAIKGAFLAAPSGRNHLVASAIEHTAVHDCCEALVEQGARFSQLGVGRDGLIDLQALDDAIGEDTLLVAIMAVNNEIGVVQPLEEIGQLCRQRGVLWLCDASQATGRVAIDVDRMAIDLLTATAHKAYGPKGVGYLYVRRQDPRVVLKPLVHGGGHEYGLRSGTLPVPLIVGLGEAVRLAEEEREQDDARLRGLRDKLWNGLQNLGHLHLNGSETARVAGNLNVAFSCVNAATLMAALPDLALSSGAACSSESPRPSHVLSAIGLSDELAHCSIRFGLGRFTTDHEVDLALAQVSAEVGRLRAKSALWELVQEGIELGSTTL